MKTLLKIAVLIALIVVIGHEIGAYAETNGRLNQGSNTLSEFAAENGLKLGRARTLRQLEQMAEAEKIVVVSYAEEGTVFVLDTQAGIEDSWIVGPFLAWQAKKPLSTPYILSKQISKPLN